MIYGHQNSREVLERELARRRADNPQFSANAFAKKIGLSQAYLSLMLSGRKHITEKAGRSIADSLKLDPIQREYFLLLIKRERAKDVDTKKLYENKLLEIKNQHFPRAADLKFFDVISEWHYSALLEAVNLSEISHTAEGLAEKLLLPVPLVRNSLRTLQKLRLIQKNGSRWERTDSGFLRTSTEIKNEALRRFHKDILKMGIRALEEQPLGERSFTGVTVALDPAKIPEAKRRILEFQRDLMKFLEDGPRTEIYQIEVQLFRLHGESEGEKK